VLAGVLMGGMSWWEMFIAIFLIKFTSIYIYHNARYCVRFTIKLGPHSIQICRLLLPRFGWRLHRPTAGQQ